MPKSEVSPINIGTESADSIQEKLSEEISKASFHLKYDHRGIPETSCHRCMNHQQRIQFLKEDLAEAKEI